MPKVIDHSTPKPVGDNHIEVEGYWITKGSLVPDTPQDYICTQSVKANLRDLARIVSAGNIPVLLQGETSVGKTSLIVYLAKRTGNVCYRINNHEHTDVQEYIGCYVADDTGKLVFREGILVEAMRKGYWIILDELNLAPTDVLEALNRLLDDNRQLFIAETQETIDACPGFMLFATQNPPGHYGGRKVLSRAFRNRFVELHFDDIPRDELVEILSRKCQLPPSYSKKIVATMHDLEQIRGTMGLFAGKRCYITPRDLFRWAERYRLTPSHEMTDGLQLLADSGYMLLAGRVRQSDEELQIKAAIEKNLGRKVNPKDLFTIGACTPANVKKLLVDITTASLPAFQHVVWTYGMRRMAVLLTQALRFSEPVLLIGETGCGKTTVCQLYAALHESRLYSVNCHLHTESSDFLGGLRPSRQHCCDDDDDSMHKLFEWCDGPLVDAMRQGATFLIDEISLADDSVLERLNSVLEPERTLLLVENGSGLNNDDSEKIVAAQSFRVIATMNPGGDYGKKELSPALRNRFTEIWCPLTWHDSDMVDIITHNIHVDVSPDQHQSIATAMLEFIKWLCATNFGSRLTVTVRDLLSWASFINKTVSSISNESVAMEDEDLTESLDISTAYIHGACLVFVDSLGSGEPRESCLTHLQEQVSNWTEPLCHLQRYNTMSLSLYSKSDITKRQICIRESLFGVDPFYVSKGK